MLTCVLLFSISAFLSLSLLLLVPLRCLQLIPSQAACPSMFVTTLSLPLLCYCSLFFFQKRGNKPPRPECTGVWIKHCRISGDVFISVSSQKCSPPHSGYVQWIICTTILSSPVYRPQTRTATKTFIHSSVHSLIQLINMCCTQHVPDTNGSWTNTSKQ